MTAQSLSELTSRLKGAAIGPDSAEYDDARNVWNGTVNKQPALVVRCAGVDDVIASVNYARGNGLGVSVRAGGHHVAGSSVIDGGLVVDLSGMRSVTVDPATSTVRCEGGALIGDVDAATQAHALAVPLGLVSETGVAGLTLGGGLGWLRRKYGLSCDNLAGAGVVTAAGQLLHASASENPDLFWALRGGGWDMGVVTAFEYQAYPLGPEVFLTFVTYSRDEGKQVLRGFDDYMATAPEGAAPLAVCWTFPEADVFPRELWGQQFVAVVGAYAGPAEEGEKVMQPLRQLGTPLTDMSGPAPYLEVQKFFDEDYPRGRRYYWRSTYLSGLTDEAIDVLLELADTRPSPLTSVDIWPLGGEIARVGADDSPFGHRQAPLAIGIESNWDDPAADAANIAWTREASAKLAPFSTGGSYLNFEDPDDKSATANAYGAANLARLLAVKQQYDPGNLFRSRRGLTG